MKSERYKKTLTVLIAAICVFSAVCIALALVNFGIIRLPGNSEETESETIETSAPMSESTTEAPTYPVSEATKETETETSTEPAKKEYITTEYLNVRSGAGTNFEKLGLLKKGEKISVISEENGWCKISYNGKDGYVFAEYLKEVKTEAESQTETEAESETTPESETETESTPETTKNDNLNGKTSKGYTVKTVKGVTYVDGVLIVNKTYALPKNYGSGIKKECSDAFDKMAKDAEKDKISLFIVSDYRSYNTQKKIYERYVKKDGKEAADTYSARPGTSEHQTGLALDVNSLSNSFGETKEGKWLAKNCYKYGFIIRYPKDKQNVTGYVYEPWHVRYIGVENAKKVYKSGLCLEEYYGITSKYN